MDDPEIPHEALAAIERVAGAIRRELGEEVDGYPGCRSPEGADPLNRAFRAVVASILAAAGIDDLASVVSRTLRLIALRRLAAEAWDADRVKALIEEEPGGPDDWLAFLILSSRAQIEPLLDDYRP